MSLRSSGTCLRILMGCMRLPRLLAEVELKLKMQFVDAGLVVAAVELASSNDASVVDPRFKFTFDPCSS